MKTANADGVYTALIQAGDEEAERAVLKGVRLPVLRALADLLYLPEAEDEDATRPRVVKAILAYRSGERGPSTQDEWEDYRPAPGDRVVGVSLTGRPVDGTVLRVEPSRSGTGAPVVTVEQPAPSGVGYCRRVAYPRDLQRITPECDPSADYCPAHGYSKCGPSTQDGRTVTAGVTEGLYCSKCGAPVAPCEPCGNGCTFPVPA